MRKFLSLSALVFLFVSCSDDDNSTEEPIMEMSYAHLVTTSNTSGMVSYRDLLDDTGTIYSFALNGTDNDGIYLDESSMDLIIASRTNNRLEKYTNLEASIAGNVQNLPLLAFSSDTDFNNPREIAVYDDKVIVTQDQADSNSNTNKLLVYQHANNSFTLLKEFTVDFKLWGIHVEGNDLFAIVDLTSDIVQFSNFIDNASGALLPTKRVTIEGLVRTHGITHCTTNNVMILTDVGSAASDSDGGIVVINNFSNVFGSTANMGTIAMSNQERIYGPNSMLGNPVDVAYDYETNKIYIAERANGGGRVLTFDFPMTSGDVAPSEMRLEPDVAGIYLLRN